MEGKNKNAKRLNFLKGSQSHSPSQTNGNAKVLINPEDAILKLKIVVGKYIGINESKDFLTVLRNALSIPDSEVASKYGADGLYLFKRID